MKINYYNWPVVMEIGDYERAISIVSNSLAEKKELIGLFQVGSVSDPGISDIDLVAVFEDGFATAQDPLAVLDNKLRYLFPHGVFAISRSHFQEYRRFLFYFKFNKLIGNLDEPNLVTFLKPDEESLLKNQIALEFLFLNYMKKEIESAYKMVDVRGTLLSAKAILFDLDFLGMNDNELARLIRQLAALRKEWFTSTPTLEVFNDWNQKLFLILRKILSECLLAKSFYLPNENDYIHYARHIKIRRASFAAPERTGFTINSPLIPIGKKYFRLWNRFNRFTFLLPWINQNIPNILVDRFSYIRELKNNQKHRYPLYSTLSGNIQNIIN